MRSYRGYIFDMDGVIYRGDDPIQDAVKAVSVLKERGRKVIFITNNSSKLASEYKSTLLGMGVEGISEDDIITSGDVAAEHLKNELKTCPDRKRVLCVAEESVKHLLREVGMDVVDPEDYRTAHYVVVGFYKPFTWKLGSCAVDAIATYGAEFIGTNPDPARPVENGEIEAGTGAIISFIEAASHTKATILGKPYPEMYQMAIQRMNLQIPDVLMVGDMLVTDIQGALDLGMDAALVLTGMTSREAIERLGITPTFVVDSLKELTSDT
ncbi:HAD-IIA family hydrolase [Candidatus Poribacteria bacterium]